MQNLGVAFIPTHTSRNITTREEKAEVQLSQGMVEHKSPLLKSGCWEPYPALGALRIWPWRGQDAKQCWHLVPGPHSSH